VHIHFIISDLCNQDCHFCAYRIEGYTEKFSIIEADGTRNHNPNRMMSYEKASEIIRDCGRLGVKAIQFTGGGEPTVHPQCAGLMTLAQGLGIETAIVTNGVRLDKVLEPVMASTWIRISIDAATEETYCGVRRVPGDHWRRMLKNVRELVDRRNAAKSPLTIGVGYVVTRENYREVYDGCALARDLGVDNIRISAMFQQDDAVYFKDFHEEAAQLCKQAEGLSTDRFTVINRFGERVSDLELGHPDYKDCAYQHFVAYIGADLNVYRCCVLSYTDRGTVGSLQEQTFAELWESKIKQDLYADFDARGCPRCQFNDKNHAINSLIEHLPIEHGNFV
jgi:MoaA/NifB/PqqE/SkfB family radical SAM enzyme